MPLTQDYKQTIATRAIADPAFAKALPEEIEHIKGNEKQAMRDMLESALIQSRRESAAQGNTIDVKVNDL